MTKHYRILFSLGLIIFILPFLGIPDTFKTITQFVVGFILITISYLYRYWYREDKRGAGESVFEESNGEDEEVVHYTEEDVVADEEDEVEEIEEEVEDEEETTNEEKEL